MVTVGIVYSVWFWFYQSEQCETQSFFLFFRKDGIKLTYYDLALRSKLKLNWRSVLHNLVIDSLSKSETTSNKPLIRKPQDYAGLYPIHNKFYHFDRFVLQSFWLGRLPTTWLIRRNRDKRLPIRMILSDVIYADTPIVEWLLRSPGLLPTGNGVCSSLLG